MKNILLKWSWLPIIVVFVAMAWPHLGFPAKPVFDEIYTATAAQEIVEGRVPHEQTHPPLSKISMALGYQFWLGGHFQEATDAWSPIAFSIRTPSVLAAVGCLIFLFLLGNVLLEDRRKATLAMALLALDSLFLVMSRTAMTNIYGMCFTLLCVLATVLAIKRAQPAWLLLAGVGLGLGGACRWTAIVGGSLCVLVVWGYLGGTRANLKTWARWFAYGILGMAVVPALIYLASYFPQVWVATHHDLHKVFSLKTADYLVRVHKFAVAMHTKLTAPNPDYSPWYTWPFMWRPVWFYIAQPNPKEYIGIWGIGNGLVWWATLPCLAYGLFQGFARRRRELLVPTLLAAGLWLVWSAAGSPINYMHYMFEAVPFVCLLLSDALVGLWDARPALRPVVVGYVALAVGWAVWFYPLLTGWTVGKDFYQQHMLLGTKAWDTQVRLKAWREQQGLADDKDYKAFLKRWYPDPEAYLEFLEGIDATRRRLQASPGPGRSPASSPPPPASAGDPAATGPAGRP